jgi:hypothetical protein
VFLIVLSLLVPVAAQAGKKPMKRKPLQLDPLGEEVATRGEYTDDLYKALRKADRCLDTDRNWQRDQERPGDSRISPNSLYELLASSVVCWQEAEKKALAQGEVFAPAALWISARARYIETYRQFVWAISAKMDGDYGKTCRRLAEATELLGDTQSSAKGMAEKYTLPGAQALGAQADAEAEALAGMVLSEVSVQKCR